MTLGAIDLTPGIGACIMAGMTGEYSAEALPDLLCGKNKSFRPHRRYLGL